MTRLTDREYYIIIMRAIIAIANAIVRRHLPGVKLYRVEAGEEQ